MKAVWPDGTECYMEDLAEMLTYMSDDYEVVKDDDEDTMDIAQLLSSAGYAVVEGEAAVRQMIEKVSDGTVERLCSGWGVFPDGTMCFGCSDCNALREGRK